MTSEEKQPVSFAKRDALREIEVKIQEKWEREKVFELDAPKEGEDQKPKFLATFPYPYMNGRLHIGHVFTLSKAEFAVGYERLQGKNALFPFGLHCTGMPIKSCADKIKYEMETFGNPPVFPISDDKSTDGDKEKELNVDAMISKKGKSKKSKAVSKKGERTKYQWEIMEESDIPKEEIHKFANADYWLDYFPNYCISDLKHMGARIDWRRSFITTDRNPYYDSFVRWQFLRLKEKGKIKFGKRYTIYSPKDGGPCLDHDRREGEYVLPMEYVLIKQQMLKPYPKVIESIKGIEGKKVFLVPATLRPETMFGQTNCWVLPDGEYGAFLMKNDEVFICTERAARNLSFQEITNEWGKVECLAKFKGSDIIGSALKAPLSPYEKIYVWPMFNVLTSKTTGVVTSVPSDAPHDYVAFRDVKEKKELREKFGLTDDMVLPYDLVPIIECPGYGNLSGKKAVEDRKIKSQNDTIPLEEAKAEVYKAGFYDGRMIVDGEYKGKKTDEVRKIIRDKLINEGLALIYSEPSDLVVSRSNDICVVALIDQWYIEYGEEEWKKMALKCLEMMETFHPDTRKIFENSFDWMTHWACSRTYGLGTKLPWDDTYLIDSLSDSTIYMAYYTIAHILHSDIYGTKEGIGKIKPSSMTPEVYDYIFLGRDKPKNTDIPDDVLELMRREFEYWYPVDLRVSGKDLIPNHLLFWIYNHVLFFGEDKWPRAVRGNGHVLLNGSKMAKSLGNFITLRNGVDRYTADGMRFTLADAGDGIDDANFTTETADGAILKIYTLIEWVKDVLSNVPLRDDDNETYTDKIFLNEIRETVILAKEAYERMEYKEVIKIAFYTFQLKREKYRIRCKAENINMSKKLIMKWIKTQMIIISPICPHFTEYIWTEILKEPSSIMNARWPEIEEVDFIILKQDKYIEDHLHQWRIDISPYMKSIKESKIIESTIEIKLFKNFPKDIVTLKKIYEELYREHGANIPKKELTDRIRKNIQSKDKKFMNKAMSYINALASEFKVIGEDVFKLDIGFNEKEVLEANINYIQSSLNVSTVKVIEDTSGEEDINWTFMPGKPSTSLKPYFYKSGQEIKVGDVVSHKINGQGVIISTDCRYPYQVKVEFEKNKNQVDIGVNTLSFVNRSQ